MTKQGGADWLAQNLLRAHVMSSRAINLSASYQEIIMRTRNRARFILAAMLVVSIASAPSRSATQSNPVQHFEDGFAASMFNDATGEIVDLQVSVKSTLHIVESSGGQAHLMVKDVFSGRGKGQSSGTAYIGNQSDSFSVVVGKGFAETSNLHFSLISKGGAANLEVRALFHVTMDANGVITAFVDNYTVKPTGK
jgi:hypothetical protein